MSTFGNKSTPYLPLENPTTMPKCLSCCIENLGAWLQAPKMYFLGQFSLRENMTHHCRGFLVIGTQTLGVQSSRDVCFEYTFGNKSTFFCLLKPRPPKLSVFFLLHSNPRKPELLGFYFLRLPLTPKVPPIHLLKTQPPWLVFLCVESSA